MSDSSDNRPDPGQRRTGNYDGLRDLQRRINPSVRDRRRARREAAAADGSSSTSARPGRTDSSGRRGGSGRDIGASWQRRLADPDEPPPGRPAPPASDTPPAGRNRAAAGGSTTSGGRATASDRPTAAGGGRAGAAMMPGNRAIGRIRGLRRRWPRRLLLGVNVLVALCLIGAAGAYGYVRHELGNVKKVTLATLTYSKGTFTVLIVGSDSRDLTGKGNAQFGSAAETPGQRSDTIMLARIVPKTRSMTLLSIPRDLYVNVAGIGETRINGAFNTGPNLLISTIQKDLGIPINHFVEINFDTFQNITDAVGGVKVWFPTPAKDDFSLLNVPTAGCVNLTGAQALGFARSRHYEYLVDGQWTTQGLSDLARIQRQQFYVKKMITKAEGKLTNPLALNNILNSVTKNLTVDSGFSTSLMLTLARDFHSADVAGIPTLTLPTFAEVVDDEDVLGLQQPQATQMISAFNALGRTSPAPVQSTTATTARSSHVTVEVANGSGTSGQAGAAAAAIDRLGYRATVTAQTPGYDFTQNDIEYAPTAKAAAEQLGAQLSGGATLTESSKLGSTPYSLELVTGASYAGVIGPHPAKATTTTSHSTTTAAPVTTVSPPTTAPSGSSLVTNYPLPGPPPTQAQLASC